MELREIRFGEQNKKRNPHLCDLCEFHCGLCGEKILKYQSHSKITADRKIQNQDNNRFKTRITHFLSNLDKKNPNSNRKIALGNQNWGKICFDVVINYTPNMRIWKTPHSLSQILE
jgi:hypothetical protein